MAMIRALAGVMVLLAATVHALEHFSHAAWDALLQRYVDEAGRVAYRDLATTDRATLDDYLRALAAARPDGWPEPDRFAFWVNAYNAAIMRAVLDGYSAENLLSRYRIFSRFTQPVAGNPRTPDEIEKTILHGMGDARMHFALVCASTSCPRLRRHTWVGETLEQDLEAEARRFILDPARNEIRIDAPTVRLSMIFAWYRADFGGTDDTVRSYVARYVDDPTRRYLLEQRPRIEHLPYDWTMNAQPGQRPR